MDNCVVIIAVADVNGAASFRLGGAAVSGLCCQRVRPGRADVVHGWPARATNFMTGAVIPLDGGLSTTVGVGV
jgi:hypothetical protein